MISSALVRTSFCEVTNRIDWFDYLEWPSFLHFSHEKKRRGSSVAATWKLDRQDAGLHFAVNMPHSSRLGRHWGRDAVREARARMWTSATPCVHAPPCCWAAAALFLYWAPFSLRSLSLAYYLLRLTGTNAFPHRMSLFLETGVSRGSAVSSFSLRPTPFSAVNRPPVAEPRST